MRRSAYALLTALALSLVCIPAGAAGNGAGAPEGRAGAAGPGKPGLAPGKRKAGKGGPGKKAGQLTDEEKAKRRAKREEIRKRKAIKAFCDRVTTHDPRACRP